jgi:catechol 2,3-dioxygenase-like lactoylglutathione lyase family enzyme
MHKRQTTISGALERIDHFAISVDEIDNAVAWYTQRFRSRVVYQDATWALLEFANVKLALVVTDQHPPHIGFTSTDAAKYGKLEHHRDGIRSVYISDPWGNSIELLEEVSS